MIALQFHESTAGSRQPDPASGRVFFVTVLRHGHAYVGRDLARIDGALWMAWLLVVVALMGVGLASRHAVEREAEPL